MAETTELEMQVRSLQIRAEDVSTDDRVIDATFATDAKVRMFDWESWKPIHEVLPAPARTDADHVLLLDSHKRGTEDCLGSCLNIRSEGGNTIGQMRFDEDENSDRILGKYRSKSLRSVSVGYAVRCHVVIPAGESAEVNGVRYEADPQLDLRVATDWFLREVSAVTIPADDGAVVRELASIRCSQVSEEQATQLLKQQRQPSLPFPETPEPSGGESAQRSTDQTPKPAESGRKETEMSDNKTTDPVVEQRQDVDVESVRKEAVEAERSRVAELRKLAGDDVRSETLQKAIDDGTSADDFRGLCLTDLREQRSSEPVGSDAPFNIQIGSDNRKARDMNAQSLGLAVAQRLGMKRSPEQLAGRMISDEVTGEMRFERDGHRASEDARKEFERQLERSDKYRNVHSIDLCRFALEMQGIEAPLERKQIATRSMSTPAVSTIYSTAIGAVLLDNLGTMMDSTIGWSAERDAKSFKEQELHRLEGGKLRRRERGTKAKSARFSDSMECYRVHEFAENLLLDRQDLVDDEIGAWLTATEEYSRSILSLRPDLVLSLLMSNPAMKTDNVNAFHADHGNILSLGLGEDSIGELLSKIAIQQNANGVNLNLQATHLIVPATSKFRGRQAANSSETRSTDNNRGTMNPLEQENLVIHGDARLDTGFVDPITETNIAANPKAFFAAVEGGAYGVTVGFLEGSNRMPWLNTTVKNSDGVYGLSIDVAHTIGAGLSDYRGLGRSIQP